MEGTKKEKRKAPPTCLLSWVKIEENVGPGGGGEESGPLKRKLLEWINHSLGKKRLGASYET